MGVLKGGDMAREKRISVMIKLETAIKIFRWLQNKLRRK